MSPDKLGASSFSLYDLGKYIYCTNTWPGSLQLSKGQLLGWPFPFPGMGKIKYIFQGRWRVIEKSLLFIGRRVKRSSWGFINVHTLNMRKGLQFLFCFTWKNSSSIRFFCMHVCRHSIRAQFHQGMTCMYHYERIIGGRYAVNCLLYTAMIWMMYYVVSYLSNLQ